MYEKLAEYYDMFMEDVPYGAWVSYIRKFLPEKGRGRDVGCGTGKFQHSPFQRQRLYASVAGQISLSGIRRSSFW